jgi:S-adenosylmethionine:tRNA ribosyltransferase-isomerase
MKAARIPNQRPRDAKLLVVDAAGGVHHVPRICLIDFLHPGDLLIGNDAATLPASLDGVHQRSGKAAEVRLAGRRSLATDDVREFTAIVFGAGDHRTRTEDRAAPPELRPGDVLVLGPLRAFVCSMLGHPRLIALRFEGTPDSIWAGIASHGKPIQYAHVTEPLALWDVWTRIASLPVAFEAPSAAFVLDWQMLASLKKRGVAFATLTNAVGISSTGDEALDARLPLDEPYYLPAATLRDIERARKHDGRIIAIGTSVARALEHAASVHDPLRAGAGVADQRIGPQTPLRVTDAIVSGAHESDTSHYQLLRAFTSDAVLRRASAELLLHGYRTHEFGDSVLIERAESLHRERRAPLPERWSETVPGGTLNQTFTDRQCPRISHTIQVGRCSLGLCTSLAGCKYGASSANF